MEITVKTLDPNDKKTNYDIKLLLAEAGHTTALKYVHGRYDPEKFWVLYHNKTPVYFSHSHLLNVDGQFFYRLGSKATRLHRYSVPIGYNKEIPGRLKSPLFYICIYHQALWAKRQNYDYPKIITLFKHYNHNSFDSHRAHKLAAKNGIFGIDSRYVETTINKTQQCIFNVIEEDIPVAYNAVLQQIDVAVEYDI